MAAKAGRIDFSSEDLAFFVFFAVYGSFASFLPRKRGEMIARAQNVVDQEHKGTLERKGYESRFWLRPRAAPRSHLWQALSLL